jgi:DNA-binding GntR family transcriptional regulator
MLSRAQALDIGVGLLIIHNMNRRPAARRAPASEIVAFPQPPAGRAEWLAGVLRQRLWAGAYRPHQWMRENVLRVEFGLSNGPVREALQLLVAENLLERVPYCGIRVVALSDREIVELFQLRLALLELAAELAARRRDEAAIARAPAVLDQVRANMKANPPPLPGHLMGWVVEASGNAQLERSWERLAGQARLYVYESTRRAADPGAMTKHAESLVNAIVAGRPAQARKAVRALTQHQISDLGLDLLLAK